MLVVVAGFIGSRYLDSRRFLPQFLLRVLVFCVFTGLMVAGRVVPYHPSVPTGTAESRRLLVAALGVIWWLTVAWFAVGFLRTFVVLGRHPHESKLGQDLLAGLVYIAATFAIIGDVFDLPVKGLLATSGAMAIIIGLALQSSLGDVFSGIVLNLERPYRVGDWIVLEEGTQGAVMETNWRATHILTGSQDVAIIPNSVIAKAKIINRSSPTLLHGVSQRVRLEPVLGPEDGRELLQHVLLGAVSILQTPEPTVTVQDVSAEMIEYELYYSVVDLGAIDRARDEVFDRVYRAVRAAGIRFAPRLNRLSGGRPSRRAVTNSARHILQSIPLFATLTTKEKAALCSDVRRRNYERGQVLAKPGATLSARGIVSRGVLVASIEKDGRNTNLLRFGPGDYFGEHSLLTGEPLKVEISALTRAVVYEVSKDALAPLFKARPELVEELSASVIQRRELVKQLNGGPQHGPDPPQNTEIRWLANRIRQLFRLH